FAYTASTTEDERNTEGETETESESKSDTVTEAPTDAPATEAPTEEVTDEPKKKGCRSTLSVSAGILVTAIMGAAVFRKRKE
ncbi:MAG: hypothetical protein II229_00460, partial [Clostridia bacterium]|nr:hypothetical protein [Clostridia bacterium]